MQKWLFPDRNPKRVLGLKATPWRQVPQSSLFLFQTSFWACLVLEHKAKAPHKSDDGPSPPSRPGLGLALQPPSHHSLFLTQRDAKLLWVLIHAAWCLAPLPLLWYSYRREHPTSLSPLPQLQGHNPFTWLTPSQASRFISGITSSRKLPLILLAKMNASGTSLGIQWLRLCTPNTKGLGSIPSWGTRSHMPQLGVHMPQLRVVMPKLRPGTAK